jgi:hypothetical protein
LIFLTLCTSGAFAYNFGLFLGFLFYTAGWLLFLLHLSRGKKRVSEEFILDRERGQLVNRRKVGRFRQLIPLVKFEEITGVALANVEENLVAGFPEKEGFFRYKGSNAVFLVAEKGRAFPVFRSDPGERASAIDTMENLSKTFDVPTYQGEVAEQLLVKSSGEVEFKPHSRLEGLIRNALLPFAMVLVPIFALLPPLVLFFSTLH